MTELNTTASSDVEEGDAVFDAAHQIQFHGQHEHVGRLLYTINWITLIDNHNLVENAGLENNL